VLIKFVEMFTLLGKLFLQLLEPGGTRSISIASQGIAWTESRRDSYGCRELKDGMKVEGIDSLLLLPSLHIHGLLGTLSFCEGVPTKVY
jgi:hypothetical protein